MLKRTIQSHWRIIFETHRKTLLFWNKTCTNLFCVAEPIADWPARLLSHRPPTDSSCRLLLHRAGETILKALAAFWPQRLGRPLDPLEIAALNPCNWHSTTRDMCAVCLPSRSHCHLEGLMTTLLSCTITPIFFVTGTYQLSRCGGGHMRESPHPSASKQLRRFSSMLPRRHADQVTGYETLF